MPHKEEKNHALINSLFLFILERRGLKWFSQWL